jgi:hypothetical protein
MKLQVLILIFICVHSSAQEFSTLPATTREIVKKFMLKSKKVTPKTYDEILCQDQLDYFYQAFSERQLWALKCTFNLKFISYLISTRDRVSARGIKLYKVGQIKVKLDM